jgi:hypothetical protein
MAVEEVVPGAALNLSLNVSPPEKFCFTRPESWTQWNKRFRTIFNRVWFIKSNRRRKNKRVVIFNGRRE